MRKYKFHIVLKELRTARNLSQSQLADDLFVHRTTIVKWESGKVIPLNDKLVILSNYFDVTMDELLYGKDNDDESSDDIIKKIILNIINKYKTIILIMLSLIVILLFFLSYYFIKTYRNNEVFLFYGSNERVKMRDGVIFLSNDKVYFRTGYFYDEVDNIVDADFVEIYYLVNNRKKVLLKSDVKTLFVENYDSSEFNLALINRSVNLYMNVCFDNRCELIDLNIYDDYVNSNLVFNDYGSINSKLITNKIDNDKLVKQLIGYGFKYNADNEYYYLFDDGVEYYYNVKNYRIDLKIKDGENRYYYYYFISIKNLTYEYKIIDDSILKYESNLLSINSESQEFLKIKKNFLSPYFLGFLQV